jgi:glycerol-3-phosphate dehydrogenase
VSHVFDLAVIGGGINGCGIARDAAGRGLSVLLMEQDDLAGATSSASTKLIHGGLRYLEHYQFRLVRESLEEREVLLRAAPHITWPLRFVLPHRRGLRPWWMIRAGLFLYDHLGGREILPGTRTLNLRRDPAGAPLRDSFRRGFEYSDCWVDDARLVVLTARDAFLRGADIRVRTRCEAARPAGDLWSLRLRGGVEERARVLVNAGGPWVSSLLSNVAGRNEPMPIRLVKGSHIVVRRLFDHERAYIFQNTDGRVVFAIPFEQDFTLIGTTDEDFVGDPASVAVSARQEAYLLDAVGSYLKQPPVAADIVWRYAGVRPLRDDGASKAQEATRDYVLELSGTPPLLSVFGGKITTHRRLAEAAMARLAPFFPGMSGKWTAGAPLPGGDFPWHGAFGLTQDLYARFPFLGAGTAARLVRTYGTLAAGIFEGTRSFADTGLLFGAGLTQLEVDWLLANEWARSADDILWRRTKLGLRIQGWGAEALARYLVDKECPAVGAWP